MAVIHGELFFAPGIPMKDLDLADNAALLRAFERRVNGLFLSPIRVLGEHAEMEEGALFSSALIVAALIESIARIQGEDGDSLISKWLESNLTAFQEHVSIGGQTLSLAAVFEQHFATVSPTTAMSLSLGRLSRGIAVPVQAVGPIVTVNPFALAEAVSEQFATFACELRRGTRDIRRFAELVRKQFGKEVEQARSEAAQTSLEA